MTEYDAQHSAILAVATVPIIFAAVRDFQKFEIPNECSLMLLALYPLHLWMSPGEIDLVGTIAAGMSVFAVTFSLYSIGRLGGGDVKLMSALAVWAGAPLVIEFVAVTTLAGGLLASIYVSRLKLVLALALDAAGNTTACRNVLSEQLPYGIAIAIGGLFVLTKLVA